MLKFYYTGSVTFNTSQSLPSRSLGGYISNTTVPNDVLNSIFSPLSLMEFYKKKKTIEYIGLGMYLFFFDEEPIFDKIKLKFNLTLSEDNEQEAEFFKDLINYKIGLAPISGNNTNGYYMETITAGAKPYYLTHDFQELKFDENIEFDNVNISDKGIGIWINRIFNPKLIKEKFGFESEYWEDHDNLPNLDFKFNLNVEFEGINSK